MAFEHADALPVLKVRKREEEGEEEEEEEEEALPR
jgi:hypothetical protein